MSEPPSFEAGRKFDDDLAALYTEPSELFQHLVAAAGLSRKVDFRGRDLREMQFTGSDLRGFDFSHSDLRGTSVRSAACVDATTILFGAQLDPEDLEWLATQNADRGSKYVGSTTNRSLPERERTLAIVLGASEWPSSPEFAAAPSFRRSALAVADYLRDQDGLNLPRRNLQVLFDSPDNAPELLAQMRQFIRLRQTELADLGTPVTDLLFFYIGHGSFSDGNTFFISVRSTDRDDPLATSITAESLGRLIRDTARNLRNYLVLDCCFAAALHHTFMTDGPLAVASAQLRDSVPREGDETVSLPESGTALFCASGASEPAKALPDHVYTMFTGSLLDVLQRGDLDAPEWLSLSDVHLLVQRYLTLQFGGAATYPQLHVPNQRYGRVDFVPLFPNVARRTSGSASFHAELPSTQHANAGVLAPSAKHDADQGHGYKGALFNSQRVAMSLEGLSSKEPEVRLRSIHGLEGVMSESEQYREELLNVLCAFVRSRTEAVLDEGPPVADVQGALTAIGREAKATGIIDLSGANIRRCNLSGSRMRQARLFRADLREANLREADLSGGDLHSSNLDSVDLRRADLRNANLKGANLKNAKLSDVNLSNAELHSANLSNADLHGANLHGADLRGADLSEADLLGADLRDANLSGCDLSGADLRGADLAHADLHDAELTHADLTRSNVSDFQLEVARGTGFQSSDGRATRPSADPSS